MDFLASSALVAAATLPGIPLLVVAATTLHKGDEPWPTGWPAGQIDAAWDLSQQELAASLPKGRLVTIDSTHRLQVHEPEALAAAIRKFLDEDVG